MKNKSTRAVGKEEACGCGSSHKPGIGDTFPILWNKQESVGKQVRLQGNLVKGSGKFGFVPVVFSKSSWESQAK